MLVLGKLHCKVTCESLHPPVVVCLSVSKVSVDYLTLGVASELRCRHVASSHILGWLTLPF